MSAGSQCEARLREAMQKLDLLVVVDLYRNATAEYADYVLPTADSFEREDLTLLRGVCMVREQHHSDEGFVCTTTYRLEEDT